MRVLLGPLQSTNNQDLLALRQTLAWPIEVRQAADGVLHDRFIIGAHRLRPPWMCQRNQKIMPFIYWSGRISVLDELCPHKGSARTHKSTLPEAL